MTNNWSGQPSDKPILGATPRAVIQAAILAFGPPEAPEDTLNTQKAMRKKAHEKLMQTIEDRGVKKYNNNQNLLNSDRFDAACSAAGIPATRRQASKFNNKRGLAYKHRSR